MASATNTLPVRNQLERTVESEEGYITISASIKRASSRRPAQLQVSYKFEPGMLDGTAYTLAMHFHRNRGSPGELTAAYVDAPYTDDLYRKNGNVEDPAAGVYEKFKERFAAGLQEDTRELLAGRRIVDLLDLQNAEPRPL